MSTALTNSDEVVLRVRDTGIGMSESQLAVALEPFGQVAQPAAASRSAVSGSDAAVNKNVPEALEAPMLKGRAEAGAGIVPQPSLDGVEPARGGSQLSELSPDDDKARRGTGLGLPLAKALAEANGARFIIKSALDSGTLVEIVFPAAAQ